MYILTDQMGLYLKSFGDGLTPELTKDKAQAMQFSRYVDAFNWRPYGFAVVEQAA